EIENNFSKKFKVLNFDFSKIGDFNLKEKNYRMNIFMDIIYKLKNIKHNLGAQKHEIIDVFIQSNLEFANFLSEREELLKVLLNVRNIEYVKDNEKMPLGYEMDNVIDINIGVKTVLEQVTISRDVLADMEEDLKNKQEYLQHMKSLVASIVGTASPEVIEKKKEDIKNLQQEIEELDFNISKMKMR
ncbi:MAG TPA: hypothetical protein PLP73_01285, partial [Candidatus Absconditabacterales bacterium]|nr:hypothetical protein [Candidatus Absconditabacterales bacterium]